MLKLLKLLFLVFFSFFAMAIRLTDFFKYIAKRQGRGAFHFHRRIPTFASVFVDRNCFENKFEHRQMKKHETQEAADIYTSFSGRLF